MLFAHEIVFRELRIDGKIQLSISKDLAQSLQLIFKSSVSKEDWYCKKKLYFYLQRIYTTIACDNIY